MRTEKNPLRPKYTALHKSVPNKIAFTRRWAPLLLLFVTLPATLQAQFTYTNNNGALTITGYTGPGGAVSIPDTINGLPVTSIGIYAFLGCAGLNNIIIPDSVTSVGPFAFTLCTNLTNAAIGTNVTTIGNSAFSECTSLNGVTIPDSVTTMGDGAFHLCRSLTSALIGTNLTSIGIYGFQGCTGLTNITIPHSVTNIRYRAFDGCTNLTNVRIGRGVTLLEYGAFDICTSLTHVYFQGNAPLATAAFSGADKVTVYYLPGTANWGSTFAGRPTALWLPQVLTSDASFGVRTNQFGFNISWSSGMAVAVDACADLANPVWTPLQTNTLTADTLYFSDPQWTNHPARFYRLRWP